jgi:hypothetical protein
MPTAAELLPSIAPEIDASSAQAVALLAMAETEVGFHFESPLRDQLVAYKAAHLITLANRSGAGGGVEMLREGSLSIMYGAASNNQGVMSTAYGQRYYALAKNHYGMVGRTGVMP